MSVRTHLSSGRGRAPRPGRGLVFEAHALSRRLGVDLSRKAVRGGRTRQLFSARCLTDDRLEHVTMNIGQTMVTSAMSERQFLMIDS